MGKDNGAGVNLHQIEFLLNFCKKTLFRETWNSCGSLLELCKASWRTIRSSNFMRGYYHPPYKLKMGHFCGSSHLGYLINWPIFGNLWAMFSIRVWLSLSVNWPSMNSGSSGFAVISTVLSLYDSSLVLDSRKFFLLYGA